METLSHISCPKCRIVWSDDFLNTGAEQDFCPACRKSVYVKRYPRLYRGEEIASEASSPLSAEGDAVCRFYSDLKAESVCDECGCFLSKKAAISWAGKNICMPCLHLLRETKGADGFLAKRTLYDNTALGLVLFLSPLSLFTAPMALYYLIRYRNSSRGIVPRGKFRWFLALFLSITFSLAWLLLLGLWVLAIVDSVGS